MSSKQITMACLDQLVSAKHQYRKFKNLFDFTVASEELKAFNLQLVIKLMLF